MSSPTDMNRFAITAKNLVKMEIESAEKKAVSAHADNMPTHIAKMVARRICNEVFKDFTEKLKEAYPSESVSSLVTLTTDAKKIEFTVVLVESIAKTIIKGEPQDEVLQDS